MSNNTSKTYILKKDLPDVKIESEFKLTGDNAYYCQFTGTLASTYIRRDVVENNPAWFEEKKVLPTATKPPIGVIPIWIHREQRRDDLKRAMDARVETSLLVPAEWVAEYQSLDAMIKGREIEKKPMSPLEAENNKTFLCTVIELSIAGTVTHYDEKIWVTDSNEPEGGTFQFISKRYDKPKIILHFIGEVYGANLDINSTYTDGINLFRAIDKNKIQNILVNVDSFQIPKELVCMASSLSL